MTSKDLIKEKLRNAATKLIRRKRVQVDSSDLLEKYFDKVDLGSMKPEEKLLSPFATYHRNEDQKGLDIVLNNRTKMREYMKPVEGLDYLHEDTKKETADYQRLARENKDLEVNAHSHLYIKS